METKQKPSPLQKAAFILLFLWLVITTMEVAPMNPPAWATGFLYGVWWILVMWGLLITSMTPSGFVILLGNRLFGRSGMIVFGFCSLWLFDVFMRRNYPSLPLTPGFALSMLYVFITFSRLGKLRL